MTTQGKHQSLPSIVFTVVSHMFTFAPSKSLRFASFFLVCFYLDGFTTLFSCLQSAKSLVSSDMFAITEPETNTLYLWQGRGSRYNDIKYASALLPLINVGNVSLCYPFSFFSCNLETFFSFFFLFFITASQAQG